MRYISEDGKVFNSEQECFEYEQKISSEKIKKEQLEIERQKKLEAINKKYEELQTLISEYRKEYSERLEGYWTPFYELVNMMYN